LSLQLAPSLYYVKNIIFEYKPESLHSEEEKGRGGLVRLGVSLKGAAYDARGFTDGDWRSVSGFL
jgi:hypothetical protein